MIRKLREDDLGQVALIENATQAVPWTEKIFKDCWGAGYPGWVLEQDAKVVSFSIVAMHGDECHLLNLCVHPRYQRQGLGSQMLLHVLHYAKQQAAMMIYLEVRESNARAIALYKKMHFTQIGTRKEYYPGLNGREDAFIFARDLGVERRSQL
jgi:ribosomal-protein-alanine N-acetyltransferase